MTLIYVNVGIIFLFHLCLFVLYYIIIILYYLDRNKSWIPYLINLMRDKNLKDYIYYQFFQLKR